MKALLCVGLLCFAFAQASYYYTPPESPCVFGVRAETVGFNSHSSVVTRVSGRYSKIEKYNHVGNLVSMELYRPDFLRTGLFTYDGKSCNVTDDSTKVWNYAKAYGWNVYYKEYSYMDFTTYNGVPCAVYYNANSLGRPDRNEEALYVDMNGFLIGSVENGNDWINRRVTNYTYFNSLITAADFTFSSGVVYRCPDPRVFNMPDLYFARCAAGTTNAFVAVVLATIVAALVLVF